MATFAVGDVQGCWTTLQQLLRRIAYNPEKDTLWFLGDVVGRGAHALEVLRFIAAAPKQVHMILGNHDLALLAYSMGIGRAPAEDRLDAVLSAADAPSLMQMLRTQPLIAEVDGHLLVHAGFLPTWTRATVRRRAQHASALLRSDAAKSLLQRYMRSSDAPVAQGEEVHADEALDVFTRLRVLDKRGRISHGFKGPLAQMPTDALAWFDWPKRCLQDTKVVFGHWAALGVHTQTGIYAIDGGCIWGGSLCALCLDDGTLWQEPSCEAHMLTPDKKATTHGA